MDASKKTKRRSTVFDSNEDEPLIALEQDKSAKQAKYSKSEIKSHETNSQVNENKTFSKIASTKTQKVKETKDKLAKPKKSAKVSEEEKEKYAFELINKMRDIFKLDSRMSDETKIVCHKISNIDELCSKIIRKDTQETLIKMGILKELKVWLEPLPDNSLPNLKIKRSILDLLTNLRITKDDLMSSGIGKIVHFYSKNSKEAVDIRKCASHLIKKWKGVVIKEETEDF